MSWLRPRRELWLNCLNLAIPRQHALKTRVERRRNIRPLFQGRDQHRGRLDRRKPVAARLAAQMAVARRPAGPENDALAFQHPRIAPPQRLGLAPGAVEQHHALDISKYRALTILDVALAIDRHDLRVRIELSDLRRAEIKHGPARR